MENTEMVPKEQAEDESAGLIPATDVQGRVDAYLANRNYIIEKIKPMLIVGVDVYTLPNMTKQSLGKPGAEKLAAFFGLNGKFTVDKETMEAMGPDVGGKKYIAYVCNLSRGGRVVGQGRGAHFLEEMRESYRMVFAEEFAQIKDTLKEGEWKGPLQGTSKSSGKPYTYWKVKDAPVFDKLALNKAIKMAQKSAFVDAVIRATGVSDLFTQDLEDAKPEEVETKVEEKPQASSMSDDPLKEEQTVPADVIYCDVAGCGGTMKKRNSSRGAFLGCDHYPNCKNTKNL